MLNRIVTFYTKFFALWVMLLAVVAYMWPEPFRVRKIVLDVFFGDTMFGIGAVLSIEIGMQNAGLGTVLFVFVCILTASVMVEFWRRQDPSPQPAKPGTVAI